MSKMKMKLTQEEYNQIEHLAECAAGASTKKEAEPYLAKLNFICNAGGYGGSARNIIGEIHSYASSAAERVGDKVHWQSCLQSSLYKLESFMVEKQTEEQSNDK